MKPEAHFAKGEEFERQEATLGQDYAELLMAGCHMAAHHFICAGAGWSESRARWTQA